MAPDPAILRRRNGRPQACDPCRQRKVSCDNAQPTCLRCRRRNQEHKCIYTINSHPVSTSDHQSLMRSTASERICPAHRRPSTVVRQPSAPTSSSSAQQSLSPDRDSDGAFPNLTTPELSNSVIPKPILNSTTQTLRQSGYLGYTSYSTVFEETSDRLSRLQGGRSIPAPVAPQLNSEVASLAAHISETTLSPITRQMSITLLKVLPDLQKTCPPPRPSPSRGDGWVRAISRRVLDTLMSPQWSKYCVPGVSDSKLEELARLLSRNSSTPVSDAVTDVDGWLAQFTGENLRWESLGMLLTDRELYDRDTAWDMGSIVSYTGLCVELMKQFADGNLLQLYVSFRRTIMESNHGVGDAGESSTVFQFLPMCSGLDYQW